MTTLQELGEWGLIEALKSRFKAVPAGWMGIGDDAAVTRLTPGWQALTTTDLLVEGTHFRRKTTQPDALGWKSLAVNLSDIAAMGGIPRWAVIGLALPGALEIDWLFEFYEGLGAAAGRFETALVGGDTVGTTGPLSIALTVIGESPEPLLRRDARAGDWLFTTGEAGLAAAGLWCLENPEREAHALLAREALKRFKDAHRRPFPQLAAGQALQAIGCRLALLDDSDGLARSAKLLAEASGLDIRLETEKIALSPELRHLASAAGVAPLRWALYGGEDYQLVGSVSPADWPLVEKALHSVGVSPGIIGACLPGTGRVWLCDRRQPLQELTGESEFDHFRARGGH